jgi:hypothetical protein
MCLDDPAIQGDGQIEWVPYPAPGINLRDLRLTLLVGRDRAFSLSKHLHFTQLANIDNSQE